MAEKIFSPALIVMTLACLRRATGLEISWLVAGSVRFVAGVSPGHSPTAGTAAGSSIVTTAALAPGTPRCNTAPSHAPGGNSSRILSINTGASAAGARNLSFGFVDFFEKLKDLFGRGSWERHSRKAQVSEGTSLLSEAPFIPYAVSRSAFTKIAPKLYQTLFDSIDRFCITIVRNTGHFWLPIRPPSAHGNMAPTGPPEWYPFSPPPTPRYLPPDAVERVIDFCDVSSPVGRRDRAILLLLARLGLRAGDLVRMRLEDIDWKGAFVHVSGKGRRETRLPLTQEVGDAIVSYVQKGRPGSHSETLFLRSRAPFRGFRSHAAVSVVVAAAFRRAGIKRPSRGAAHLLRHSIASSMLRQGASLQEIAALLRHRSIETTQIYAKIDVTALQQIAQPWPEVQSC